MKDKTKNRSIPQILQGMETVVRKIEREYNLDSQHEIKRFESYLKFNLALEECRDGHCPSLSKDWRVIWFLSDISLDEYIRTRAFFYSKDNQGTDDDDRYERAAGLVETVFRCNKEPALETYLLFRDLMLIGRRKRRAVFFEAARRRKAYWMYMTYAPNNNPYTDYCGACRFIDDLDRLSAKKRCSRQDIDDAKKLLAEHRHIANALDLYRICAIRKKCATHISRSSGESEYAMPAITVPPDP
ncbi:MAG: hypothetical protein AB1646_10615 [Thermodesulfobacteriota bacterium]